jgi:hypothetical protein
MTMTTLSQQRIQKATMQELFATIRNLENIHSGINESICTVYLARMEKAYPGFVDKEIRQVLLAHYPALFHPDTLLDHDNMRKSLELIGGRIPLNFTQRQICGLYAWSAMMMKHYEFALWQAIKTQFAYILEIEDVFTYFDDIKNGGTPHLGAVDASAHILATLKSIALEQYDHFEKK